MKDANENAPTGQGRGAGMQSLGQGLQFDNITVAYSRGSDTFDATPVQKVADTWGEFLDAIDTDRGTAKGQQWIAGPCAVAPDDDHHRNGGTNGSFAKAIGKPHRCKRCAEARRFIGLDVDDGLTAEAFAALVDHLQRYSGMVYTTASHTPEAPRCRVVLELDMPAPRADLIAATQAIRARIGEALADYGPLPWDPACDKPEQPLYLPVKDSSVYRLEGEALVLAELLADRPPEAPKLGNLASPTPVAGATRYALAALDSAVRKVATMPAGSRNELINREAYGLGGFVPSGQLEAATIEAALIRATEAAGWDNPERTRQKIVDGINAGSLAPRADGLESGDDEAVNQCTDLANAYRLVAGYGERMLYVEGIGWHKWMPPWRLDELGTRQLAHALGRIVADEADGMASWVAKAPDLKEQQRREAVQKTRRDWAKSCESGARITAALIEAQPLLRAKAEDMDADPDVIGLANGVLDLRGFDFRPYTHTDRITKQARVSYDPDATCPRWEAFVAQIMDGDPELVEFLQVLSGYILTGHRGEHVLPVFHGAGANGKSTFMGALQHMLGDYAGTAAPGLLIYRHGAEHPTGLAALQGKRLVVASETGEGGTLAEAQVKQLTGGDRIAARRMRQDFFEFDPTHQIVLATNHKPRVTGTDEGIWRRLRLVPFAVTVPESDRDPELPTKLATEAAGILNWCLAGLRAYRAGGLPYPEAIRVATLEYRTASDQVGGFLEECTTQGQGQRALASELYKAYSQWSQDSGERAMAQRTFGLRLAERGFRSIRGHGGTRYWEGLRVLDSERREYLRAVNGE